MDGAIVTPGERLEFPSAGSRVVGKRGTYTNGSGELFASVVGKVVFHPADNSVEVVSSKRDVAEVVPYVGAIVLCKVVRVTTKFCDLQILCVGDIPVRSTSGFKGTLRKENVRAFEVDQIDMFNCFRMGDIVAASVAALGGARSYELSTAANNLGVVHATCAVSGQSMVPASWETMRCPLTGVIEKRKVAKVEV